MGHGGAASWTAALAVKQIPYLGRIPSGRHSSADQQGVHVKYACAIHHKSMMPATLTGQGVLQCQQLCGAEPKKALSIHCDKVHRLVVRPSSIPFISSTAGVDSNGWLNLLHNSAAPNCQAYRKPASPCTASFHGAACVCRMKRTTPQAKTSFIAAS